MKEALKEFERANQAYLDMRKHDDLQNAKAYVARLEDDTETMERFYKATTDIAESTLIRNERHAAAIELCKAIGVDPEQLKDALT